MQRIIYKFGNTKLWKLWYKNCIDISGAHRWKWYSSVGSIYPTINLHWFQWQSKQLFLYNFYLKPKTIDYGKKKIEASKLIYQGVLESIKGFKEIKLLEKQNFFKSLVKKGAGEIFRNEFKNLGDLSWLSTEDIGANLP